MPHKRPKSSVRLAQQKEKGFDLPPKHTPKSLDDAPKGAMRILNAESVRQQWRERKRKLEESGDTGSGNSRLGEQGVGSAGKKRKISAEVHGKYASNEREKEKEKAKEKGKGKEELKLKPGESLAEFNRRVDQTLVPRIRASKSSKTKAKALATQEAAKPPPTPQAAQKPRKTDFDTAPTVRRLNDVAQAPPSLTHLPRNASKLKVKQGEGKVEGVVSIATRKALEEERRRVVERYRMMKEGRIREREEREAGKGGEKEGT